MKLAIAVALFGIGLPVFAVENATRVLTPQEAIHAPHGTEVTVAFRVKEATCNVLGMVPRGQEPSFQLIPHGEDGDASFSVWIAGQLVLDARRLGIDTYFPLPGRRPARDQCDRAEWTARFQKAFPAWEELIANSFLSPE